MIHDILMIKEPRKRIDGLFVCQIHDLVATMCAVLKIYVNLLLWLVILSGAALVRL